MALVRDPPAPKERILGRMVKVDGIGLRVFKKWGTRCVCCGIEGMFFSLECHKNESQELQFPNLSLYAVEEGRCHVRINIDHVVPKSKGGTYNLNNLRPLCVRCNTEKGNRSIIPSIPLPPKPEQGIPRLLHERVESCKDCPFIQWSDCKGGMVCTRAYKSPWLDGAARHAISATEHYDPIAPPLVRWKPIPWWCPLPLVDLG